MVYITGFLPFVDVCVLTQDSGECLGNVPAWYYDNVSGGCVQFIYGGCGGNANRFETEDQCLSKCGIIIPEVVGLGLCSFSEILWCLQIFHRAVNFVRLYPLDPLPPSPFPLPPAPWIAYMCLIDQVTTSRNCVFLIWEFLSS